MHFNEVIPPVPEGFVEDPFCVGLNCYAEVSNSGTVKSVNKGWHLKIRTPAFNYGPKCFII